MVEAGGLTNQVLHASERNVKITSSGVRTNNIGSGVPLGDSGVGKTVLVMISRQRSSSVMVPYVIRSAGSGSVHDVKPESWEVGARVWRSQLTVVQN